MGRIQNPIHQFSPCFTACYSEETTRKTQPIFRHALRIFSFLGAVCHNISVPLTTVWFPIVSIQSISLRICLRFLFPTEFMLGRSMSQEVIGTLFNTDFFSSLTNLASGTFWRSASWREIPSSSCANTTGSLTLNWHRSWAYSRTSSRRTSPECVSPAAWLQSETVDTQVFLICCLFSSKNYYGCITKENFVAEELHIYRVLIFRGNDRLLLVVNRMNQPAQFQQLMKHGWPLYMKKLKWPTSKF